ncbi:MAG: hypothetical protein CBARDMAM_3924 [uncultured Caballeronia sp.]|nr:MAG: hypothetical protein CBARDMAM_3924 [uncultured Caballeronia sp.]
MYVHTQTRKCKDKKMPRVDEKEVAKQLSRKRWFLLFAISSLMGFVTERLFSRTYGRLYWSSQPS